MVKGETPMTKRTWNYTYVNLQKTPQYTTKNKIVNAKYFPAEFQIDKGNPFIEALPHHPILQDKFYDTLINSYRARYSLFVSYINIPNVSKAHFNYIDSINEEQLSKLKFLLKSYPQVILHFPSELSKIPQIVYLHIKCEPNDTLDKFALKFGKAIDKALENETPIYTTLLDKIKSQDEKKAKICELIENFFIGLLIVEHTNLLDANQLRTPLANSLLHFANSTNVAIKVFETK